MAALKVPLARQEHQVTGCLHWSSCRLTATRPLWTIHHGAGVTCPPWARCRYQREGNEGHRPALRRVLEHDAPAGRSIVLCVSDIAMPFPAAQQGRQPLQPAAQPGGVGPQLELTDGWYCVWAVLDKPLSQLVRSGKIGVGKRPGWKPPCSPGLA